MRSGIAYKALGQGGSGCRSGSVFVVSDTIM